VVSHFTPGDKAPSMHLIGGWVYPRAVLDDMKKFKFLTLLGLEFRPVGCPVRSKSLYQLCYHQGRRVHGCGGTIASL
jgi:hypothetical protein